MLYILEVAYCPVFCENQLLNSCCSHVSFIIAQTGGVTPIDSIITAVTMLVNPYTKEGVESQMHSIYFCKCVHNQQSTVEIQRSQSSKP